MSDIQQQVYSAIASVADNKKARIGRGTELIGEGRLFRTADALAAEFVGPMQRAA